MTKEQKLDYIDQYVSGRIGIGDLCQHVPEVYAKGNQILDKIMKERELRQSYVSN